MAYGINIQNPETSKPLNREFVTKKLHATFTGFAEKKEDAEKLPNVELAKSYGLGIQILEVGLLLALLEDNEVGKEIKTQLKNSTDGDYYFPWLQKMVVQAAVITEIHRNVPGASIEIVSPEIRQTCKYDFSYNGHPVICRVNRDPRHQFYGYYNESDQDLKLPGNPEKLKRIPTKAQASYNTCCAETGEQALVVVVPLRRTRFMQGYNGITTEVS